MRIIEYFKYDHLPENLQSISKPICELVKELDEIYQIVRKSYLD